MKNIALLIALLLGSTGSFAQKLALISGNQSGVAVYADPRIVVLAKNPPAKVPTIRSGRGYRVQIYNGNDRAKALQIKRDFMQLHPEVRTYFSYIRPQFRVKVGDYKSRAEAAEMYRQVNNLYSPCMIVPDIVTIKENIVDDQPNTGEDE